jgi:hypothetical protein
LHQLENSRGDHSLLYFAYTCVRDLFIGGVIYLAKKIIRWWYFTCKEPENIICDGILHVKMFHYFKIPYFICNFFTKFTYNEYIGPYFLSHVVLRFSPSDLPGWKLQLCDRWITSYFAEKEMIFLSHIHYEVGFHLHSASQTRGVHSLLYFAYTCVRDLFIGGGIYLAKKIIRWWCFTCKKHENIICDGILHVNMFHYFKIPYFTCTFFTEFTHNEYIGPCFLSHVVLRFLLVNSPSSQNKCWW